MGNGLPRKEKSRGIRRKAFRRARSGLLLVPEARGIFPGLSVEENLQVLLRDHVARRDTGSDW